MKNNIHTDPTDTYFNLYKPWMISFIPDGPNKILDIGCGSGRLGKKLKEMNKAGELIGVEIYQPAADEASKYYDKVFRGNIEKMVLDYDEYFDFVICGDIIEHLRDPWSLLKRIHCCIKVDGLFITSIPNIRYWRVLRDLILFGKLEYAADGILDATHLRFFTRKSILKILRDSKYYIIYSGMMVHGLKQSIFNKITFSVLEEFMGSQIMIVASKSERK
jgi:2-polyprenyl-3-methyl-5-hydroxy-6-metoxy-1,4-benzoquinol methylase